MKFTLSDPIWIHELGKRTNQEDSLFPSEGQATSEDRVFVLCDGMGGHEAGEVASSSVCESLGRWFRKHVSTDDILTTATFNEALSAAYKDLDMRDNGASEKKMGTTMTFLMFHAGGVTAAHIGDSRIYQLRPREAKPLFKTNDHSLVNDLVRLGEITEEEARTSPNRNVITRAMQPGEHRSKADIALLTDVQPGDWFYLCSDGMLEKMEDEEMVALITDETLSPDEKRQELIRRTSDNKDNHTAWLIQVTAVEGIPLASDADTTETEPVVMELKEDPIARNVTLPKKKRTPFLLWLLMGLVALLLAVYLLKPLLHSSKVNEENPIETTETPLPDE